MARISYIHGIPENEILDRSKLVKPAPYLNPLAMSSGEMYLRLMRDQAETLRQYFPDKPLYSKAVALIDNSLHKGIGAITAPTGSVEPGLYPVMRAIDIYKLERGPAVRPSAAIGSSWTDASLVAGIGAEIPQINAEFAVWWFLNDGPFLKSKGIKDASALKKFLDAAKNQVPNPPRNDLEKHWADAWKNWSNQRYIIDLYNDTLQKFAHHPLYSFLPQGNKYTQSVTTKAILHGAGVQSLAGIGEFSNDNMSLWTRNSILRENIAKAVGALSPEQTAFALTALPDSEFANFLGAKASGPVNRAKGDKIGIAPAVIAAILAVVSAAIAAAAQMKVAVEQRKTAALSGVQGWGTQVYAANQKDWDGYTQTGAPGDAPGGGNLPLIIGGAAAAYFLLKK